MNTFLRPYNPKDFENHTYFTRHLILLLLAISSTVSVHGSILSVLVFLAVSHNLQSLESNLLEFKSDC